MTIGRSKEPKVVTGQEKEEEVPLSPPATKRSSGSKRNTPTDNTPSTTLLLASIKGKKKQEPFKPMEAKQPTLLEGTVPSLLSLGATRSKKSQTDATQSLTKKDPPQGMTEEEFDAVDNEIEGLLASVKVKPKSKQKEPTQSSGKRKASRVLFDSPEPAQVTVVEPEEAPVAPKIVHPFKTVLTATVRVERVKDILSNFVEKK
jgi:hypothetical protein